MLGARFSDRAVKVISPSFDSEGAPVGEGRADSSRMTNSGGGVTVSQWPSSIWEFFGWQSVRHEARHLAQVRVAGFDEAAGRFITEWA